MHSKSRNSVIILASIAMCCVVPMLGMVLRGSASVTAHETNLLQFLATWPEWLRDCSAILAYMFSTVGCVALVAMLAVADHRITRDARIVGRDVIVSVAPIVYVTGVKWLVKRPRPITSEGSGLLPGDPSFPSGHTAAAVIVATMLLLTMRNLAHKRFSDGRTDSVRLVVCRTIIGAVALVVVVACSRLLLGLHYPTDVVVSAVVCPLISYAVWCVWDLRDKERR
ncbi:phosphatase PAP2 family protein [uncultured Bifidobacterium sp.]|uniref:phosphatase PAP2 family protein n=2 Tax=Bifidobacterium TaxID=1678 RepID=UPI000EC23D89|nr:phosphatase PAP2 family protein [uncultured Bifidobacterium sp.]HCA74205.1 phosphatase PAP2 family protein [Bifidobacterium sp.]